MFFGHVPCIIMYNYRWLNKLIIQDHSIYQNTMLLPFDNITLPYLFMFFFFFMKLIYILLKIFILTHSFSKLKIYILKYSHIELY